MHPPGEVWRTALSSRLRSTRVASAGETRSGGGDPRSQVRSISRALAVGRTPSTTLPMSSSTSIGRGVRSISPLVMRLSSNRSSTSRVRRSVSSPIECRYRFTSAGSSTTPSSIASAIARMPASGLRRSCETHATSSRRDRSSISSRSWASTNSVDIRANCSPSRPSSLTEASGPCSGVSPAAMDRDMSTSAPVSRLMRRVSLHAESRPTIAADAAMTANAVRS